jgi:SAM-dependent methyltransferase
MFTVTSGGSAFDGPNYQSRFDALAADGVDVHGEATFVMGLAPGSVLDAGCGTGRVAIELHRRGVAVLGVDVDHSMIGEARRLGPEVEWVEADVSELDLGRTFDVVVMAGNVPLFCPQARRDGLVQASARHVARPSGRLVAGFQLDRGYDLDAYDRSCTAAGLDLAERWGTWDRQTFVASAGYAVSVHTPRPAGAPTR